MPDTEPYTGPVRATTAGTAAGDDAAETTRLLRGELGAPHPVPLPMLPDALLGTTALCRSVVHLPGLAVSLTPHGWRLTGARAGSDTAARRGRAQHASLVSLTADLLAAEPAGPTVLAVAGPATVAARLALPGGEPVPADAGALRDLAQAWVEGVVELAAGVEASLPGARVVVDVREPDLHDVITGRVRSSSGYRTLPAWDRAQVRSAWVAAAERTALWLPGPTAAAGAAGAAGTGEEPTGLEAAAALVVDLNGGDPQEWEPLAGWIEAGRDVVLRTPPASTAPAPATATATATRPEPGRRPRPHQRPERVADRALSIADPFRRFGLPAADLERLVVSTGSDRPLAPQALQREATRARELADALDVVRHDDLAALAARGDRGR